MAEAATDALDNRERLYVDKLFHEAVAEAESRMDETRGHGTGAIKAHKQKAENLRSAYEKLFGEEL